MRKYEIDFLRVSAFLILIFYHTGMFFVSWEFHLKNNEISVGLQGPMFFVNQWRLSLLFFISGIGTFFSISKRSTGSFIQERFLRLIIPLIFGMMVIVPPQVYFERLVEGVPYHSYFDFYPKDAFKGSYPEGNISWHHLWFLPYLFIFSIVLAFCKKPIGYIGKFISKTLKLNTNAWLALILICIPTFIFEYWLRPIYPVTHSLVGDRFTFYNYLWTFICGYLIALFIDKTWPVIEKYKYITLTLGIIAFSIYHVSLIQSIYPLKAAIRTLNMWCWIFTLTGFAITFFNKPSIGLSYANQAVYPFYILHQTVIIAIGYYIYNLDMSIFSKFIIMVSGTFLSCWFLYEFFIRRFIPLRILFGMKKS